MQKFIPEITGNPKYYMLISQIFATHSTYMYVSLISHTSHRGLCNTLITPRRKQKNAHKPRRTNCKQLILKFFATRIQTIPHFAFYLTYILYIIHKIYT